MDIPRSNSKLRYDYNRQRLRRQCREILAKHISYDLEQKTDLNIQPARVRLTNTERYGYYWLHKPEAAHIFSKCLSRQTIAAYEEICSGVGVNFEAVAASRACFQNSLENPVIVQSAPQLSVPEGSSEVESIDTREAYDMSTELMHRLLLSAQQCLVAERVERESKECEIRALEAKYERLSAEHTQTTDIMYKCLTTLDVITASVRELREEINRSMERMVLEKSQ
ncbi:hypothetical protein V8C42DRAFT_356493 [Trichoderma barbatum]